MGLRIVLLGSYPLRSQNFPGQDRVMVLYNSTDELTSVIRSVLLSYYIFLKFDLHFTLLIFSINLLNFQSGSLVDSNFPSMVMPLMWPDVQANENRQPYQQLWNDDTLHQPVWGREEDPHNFIAPEHSLLSYDSSANSGKLDFTMFSLPLPTALLHN